MSSSSRLVLRDVPLDAALFVPALSVHRSNRKNQYLSEDQNKRRIFEQHIDRTKPSKSDINSAQKKNEIFFPKKSPSVISPKTYNLKRNQQKTKTNSPNRIDRFPLHRSGRDRSNPEEKSHQKKKNPFDSKKRRGKSESNQIKRKG